MKYQNGQFQVVLPKQGLTDDSLKIVEVVKSLEDSFIEELKEVSGINERYKLFSERFLNSWLSDSYQIRAFIFLLARKYRKEGGLELLGVCPYYRLKLKTRTHRFTQWCAKTGEECMCTIPQPRCVVRDGENETLRYGKELCFIF